MKTQPLVSIITPTFNSISFLTETLESLQQQTYKNWECILVDDGSIDGTCEVLKDFEKIDPRFKCFNRPNYKEKGPSACRNYGIEKASGDFVIFLDSDDLLAPFCINSRLEFIRDNPSYDIWVFPMQTFIGNLSNKKHLYGYFESEKDSEYLIKKFQSGGHPFAITCPVWKKNVLMDLEGFNEKLKIFTDPDLHLRMFEKGFKLKLALNYTADCFYRLNENYRHKIDYKKILHNNLIFFDHHLDTNSKEINYYFRDVIGKYIFCNKDIRYLKQYLQLGFKKGTFGYIILIPSFIIMAFHLFNLQDRRGIGYHFFKQKFNSCFKAL